jgi:hypothetical protein
LNRRPFAYYANALPLSYCGLIEYKAASIVSHIVWSQVRLTPTLFVFMLCDHVGLENEDRTHQPQNSRRGQSPLAFKTNSLTTRTRCQFVPFAANSVFLRSLREEDISIVLPSYYSFLKKGLDKVHEWHIAQAKIIDYFECSAPFANRGQKNQTTAASPTAPKICSRAGAPEVRVYVRAVYRVGIYWGVDLRFKSRVS